MSIWIVDDNEGFCRLITRVAREMGVSIRTFGNGSEAREALSCDVERPALLILDILMPEMDGIELISSLTKVEIACPVVFMTGGHEVLAEAAAVMAREKGIEVHGMVKKPVSVGALKEIMAHAA